MTTVKVGSQDAEGFHPNGDIVDPKGILEVVAGPLATKANAASLALKLDKTEAAQTYVRFEDTDGNPVVGKNVVIQVDVSTGDIVSIIAEEN